MEHQLSNFALLVWKNLTIFKRRRWLILIDLALPFIFSCILSFQRVSTDSTDHDNVTTFDPFDVSFRDRVPETYERNASFQFCYSPRSPATDDVMERFLTSLHNKYPWMQNYSIKGFESKDHIQTYYNIYKSIMPMSFHFDNVDPGLERLPKHVMYRLMPTTLLDDKWQTHYKFKFILCQPYDDDDDNDFDFPGYRERGILTMLRTMDEAILSHWGQEPVNWNINTQRMPLPSFVEDPILEHFKSSMPGVVMASFIMTVIIITKAIVHEKETQLKEGMKMMGLTSTVYWISSFITYLLFMYVLVFIYTVTGLAITVKHSSFMVMNMFMNVYGMTIVSFCFMISVFVQKANLGAVIAVVIYIATYIPQYFFEFDDLSQTTKMVSGFLFNTAMTWGIRTILYYEETGEGAHFNNMFDSPSVDHTYTLADSMLSLIIDTLIHVLVVWYVDNVYPGKYGVPKPWYFPFTKSYWLPKHAPKQDSGSYVENDPKYFEEDPSLLAGVSISNLRKVYGEKVVVEGISFKMYMDQITVLLGHNGAGKSTTIGMLTGLVQPTSGTALINGYDIWTETESVRSNLGFCPQHNILFETLNVEEHLYFFAVLKGLSRSDAQVEAKKYISEVGLMGKESTLAKHLSGGQKRKLSVGVALVAGSKVVILDEPSSGLDPGARRQMWELLQRNKHGRTVVLNTHYMEEADVLGDRILIMAQGVIQCSGSSMFLKKLYGEGYHLVLVKGDKYDTKEVDKLITSSIPNSRFEEEVGCEVNYHLPILQSHKFAELFRVLEENQRSLGLDGFGTTATTMEEVFLKVGDDCKAATQLHSPSQKQNDVTLSGNDDTSSLASFHLGDGHQIGPSFENLSNGYRVKEGHDLAKAQVKAMFFKKALYSKRNWILSLLQFLIPIIFATTAIIIANNVPDNRKEKRIQYDLSDFDDVVNVYSEGILPSSVSTQMSKYYLNYVEDMGDGEKYINIDRKKWPDVQSYFLKDRIENVGLSTFNQRYVTGAGFEPTSSGNVSVTAFFNTRPWHSEPIALVEVMNSVVRQIMGEDYCIQTDLDPMPRQGKNQATDILKHSSSTSLVVALFIGIGMAFLVTSFVFTTIQEHTIGSKHLQTVSGISPVMYWGPTYLWDFINYFFPSLAIIFIFLIDDQEPLVKDDALSATFLLLVVYGWASIPLSYILQFMFQNATNGFAVIFMFNIFTCIFPVMVAIVVQASVDDRGVDNSLRFLLALSSPSASLGMSVMDLYQNHDNKDFCDFTNSSIACVLGILHPCCKDTCDDSCLEFEDSPLSIESPAIGRYILVLFIQGCLALMVLFMKEYHIFDKIFYYIYGENSLTAASPLLHNEVTNPDEDSDVVKERIRIQKLSDHETKIPGSLVITDLCKQYNDFLAVEHLYASVDRQECFGLLGENGAGKTSTFNMLTGKTLVSGGNAFMGGWGVKNNLKMVQSNMGYCPQFDALTIQLTGRETLTFYGRVKGIPEDSLHGIIVTLMDGLGFAPHIDKLVKNYSGGNKRKLSTAVALLGDPDFLFLDEPSSSMDPAARRHLWDVLGHLRESGKTLILTSHSMEECDALCTRIAIMVNGKFKCLGSPQHLKNKFGQGYILKAKMVNMQNMEDEDQSKVMDEVVRFIQQHIPSAKVFDIHEGYLHIQVPEGAAMLSDIFSLMEQTKATLSVYDYSVHQTSLEQVFLSFARHQNVWTKNESRGCLKRLCCCKCR